MARYIAKTGKDVSGTSLFVLTSEQLRKEFGQATLYSNRQQPRPWCCKELLTNVDRRRCCSYAKKGTTQPRLPRISQKKALR